MALFFCALIQAAMLALSRSIDHFNPDRGIKWSTFATHMIRWTTARYSRREAKHRATRLRETVDLPAAPDEELERQEGREHAKHILDHALPTLPARLRRALTMRYGLGDVEPLTQH